MSVRTPSVSQFEIYLRSKPPKLVVFWCFELIFTWYTTTFYCFVALHLRWLTTEKFRNYETVRGGCIPIKNRFKTQEYNQLRWLASNMNFKLLHTGCPKAHEQTISFISQLRPCKFSNLFDSLVLVVGKLFHFYVILSFINSLMVHVQFIKPPGKCNGHVVDVLRMGVEEEARAASSFRRTAVDQPIKMSLCKMMK